MNDDYIPNEKSTHKNENWVLRDEFEDNFLAKSMSWYETVSRLIPLRTSVKRLLKKKNEAYTNWNEKKKLRKKSRKRKSFANHLYE